MVDFAGLLGPETYAQKDPRSLAQVLEEAIRRQHEGLIAGGQDIANQQAGYNLGQEKELSGLVNPIRDAALRSAQPGQNIPPYLGGQSPAPSSVPPQMAAAPVPANLPTALQAGDAAIRNFPSYLGAQKPAQTAQDPYQAALSEAAQLRQERQQFEASRDSPQAAIAIQSSPAIKAMSDAQDANLKSRENEVGQKLQLAGKQQWAELYPQLNQIRAQAIQKIGGGLQPVIDPNTGKPMIDPKTGQPKMKTVIPSTDASIAAYDKLVSDIETAVVNKNPYLVNSDDYKNFHADLKDIKTIPQPNMAITMNTPPPASVRDNAIARIAEGKSTISEEMAKSGRGGPAAQTYHDQLAEGVPAYVRPGESEPLRPDFSEAADEGGNKFAQSPKVKAALTQMQNAYSTVGRLKTVFSALKNGQYPDLNAAINAGAVKIGDVNTARANIAAILGNDELTKAFAAGGVPTDKLRDMAGALVNKNLSPEQMSAQFDELLQGTERQYNAYEAQSSGHIKPLDVSKLGGGSANAGPAQPKTQAEFKALPSGSHWVDSQGKEHIKN